MTTLSDLQAVIELACTVEDRSDAEQRALLRLARRADDEANRLTSTNPNVRYRPGRAEVIEPSFFEDRVMATRVVDAGGDQRHIALKAKRTPLRLVEEMSR